MHRPTRLHASRFANPKGSVHGSMISANSDVGPIYRGSSAFSSGLIQDLLTREALRDERLEALQREVKELRNSVNTLLVDADFVPSERRRVRDGDESADTKYAPVGSDDEEDDESDESVSLVLTVTPSLPVGLPQSHSAGSLRQSLPAADCDLPASSNLLQVPQINAAQRGLQQSASAPTLSCWRFNRHLQPESSREIEISRSPQSSRDIDRGAAASRFWGGLDAASAAIAFGEEWGEWHPPPTLYAYCVFRVSIEEQLPLREAWYLVLMLTCQVTLVYSFSISESLNAFQRHMGTLENLDSEDLTCKYWPMVFHDRPLMFLASVACTTVVVLGYMRIKDRDVMMTFHPEPRNFWAKYLINYAWFIQAIWLPTMFCGVTANLLWASEALMMNSVSLSYLLELDSYMFSAFVSDQKKELYREDALAMNRHANMVQIHRAEWKLYVVGLLQCACISLTLHFLNWFQVKDYTYALGLWCTSAAYVFVYGVRAGLLRVIRPCRYDEGEDMGTTSVTAQTSLTFRMSALLGWTHFVAMTLAWAPMTTYPPWLFSYCKWSN